MAVMDATKIEQGQNDGGQPEGQPSTEVETPEQGNLPSDEIEKEVSPWDRAKADGYLPEDYKEDPYELAKSLKNAQGFVNEANADKAKRGKAEHDRETQEATQAEILSMVPEFMRNGMELTEEMETKAKELNIDIRDLKLGAIDMRDNITASYAIVGGEEEYAAMMKDMGETMSDDEKRMFNADLGGKASKYAIAGLHAAWKEKTGVQAPQQNGRVEGKVSSRSGVKPYADQHEMLRDLTYLKTKGKTDLAARKKYEARKAVTDDKIVYGR